MCCANPSSDALREAFRLEVKRRQRQSDGTTSLEGVRFEVVSITSGGLNAVAACDLAVTFSARWC